ncbi:MAG: Futalosine hydrolase [Bacteroidia bacterium]|nr:Futalosine hydrolase [Bacteroidia bacterium]
MKILIVAATKLEVKPLLNKLKDLKFNPEVLITGVGMVPTAFSLGNVLSVKKYDAALNLGICGSFNRNLKIGEVVNVTEDIFSELGAEDGDSFLKLSDMKFADKKDVMLKPAKKFSSSVLKEFKKVKGITVNTVHGNKKSISKVVELYNPDVESMEGAAFFYACNRLNIPSVQLRAVSNYVEHRNSKNWNIKLAVENLTEAALGLF